MIKSICALSILLLSAVGLTAEPTPKFTLGKVTIRENKKALSKITKSDNTIANALLLCVEEDLQVWGDGNGFLRTSLWSGSNTVKLAFVVGAIGYKPESFTCTVEQLKRKLREGISLEKYNPASSTKNLTWRVEDEQQNGIAEAVAMGYNVPAFGRSDDDGNFQLLIDETDLNGSSQVIIAKEGYKSLVTTVGDLQSGRAVTLKPVERKSARILLTFTNHLDCSLSKVEVSIDDEKLGYSDANGNFGLSFASAPEDTLGILYSYWIDEGKLQMREKKFIRVEPGQLLVDTMRVNQQDIDQQAIKNITALTEENTRLKERLAATNSERRFIAALRLSRWDVKVREKDTVKDIGRWAVPQVGFAYVDNFRQGVKPAN